ncbi:hypothetical protein WMF11_24945 [Sorangium sp. So ce295]|uniref:hypothetical protein n=1 Tax=Sorangium sp. So ce295 TaxID=3133295 RepID=UPI003F619EA1
MPAEPAGAGELQGSDGDASARRARLSAQACPPLRCLREPEQPTDRLVNDSGRLLVPERDGAGKRLGERGDHGGPR